MDGRLASVRTEIVKLTEVLLDHHEDRTIDSAFALFQKSLDPAQSIIGIAVAQESHMEQMETGLLQNRSKPRSCRGEPCGVHGTRRPIQECHGTHLVHRGFDRGWSGAFLIGVGARAVGRARGGESMRPITGKRIRLRPGELIVRRRTESGPGPSPPPFTKTGESSLLSRGRNARLPCRTESDLCR